MKVLFLPDYSAANAYQRALTAGLEEHGVSVSADPTGARRVLPIVEALRRHGRPDVIHIHWTEPYIAGGSSKVSRLKAQRTLFELRLAKRAGVGLVWTAHDLFRHRGLAAAFLPDLPDIAAQVSTGSHLPTLGRHAVTEGFLGLVHGISGKKLDHVAFRAGHDVHRRGRVVEKNISRKILRNLDLGASPQSNGIFGKLR